MKVIRLLIRCSLAHGRKSHPAVRTGSKIHSLKSGKTYSPAIECRHRVDTDSVEPVRARLVEGDHTRIHLCDLQEKILVAHAGETVLLFVRRKSRQVINFRS